MSNIIYRNRRYTATGYNYGNSRIIFRDYTTSNTIKHRSSSNFSHPEKFLRWTRRLSVNFSGESFVFAMINSTP